MSEPTQTRQIVTRAARRMKAAAVWAGVFWWLVACLQRLAGVVSSR